MSQEPWMQTFSGVAFDLANPKAADVRLMDIAHHLSNICRFTGACRTFYSVAQHCCHGHDVLWEIHPLLAKYFLLHDAPEAYTSDFGSPQKARIPGFRDFEAAVTKVVDEHFGLMWTDPIKHVIKFVDLALLATEKRDLMGTPPKPWAPLPPPFLRLRIEGWLPLQAETEYLQRARKHSLLGSGESRLDPAYIQPRPTVDDELLNYVRYAERELARL